jgi:hypothetical protein
LKQATAFENIILDCKVGWKTEPARNKKWNVRFVAKQLALLLMLRQQVKKAKEMACCDAAQQRTFCSESASGGGVPKNNSLKQAFNKLWNAYKNPLRNYVVAKKKKDNAIYRTPSLSLQLNRQRDQDQVAWGSWTKCPTACLVCMHALTMPMQSPAEVNAANAWLRAAAEANCGDGKFKGAVDKSGCYCFCQNCFGDENGIGCWHCFELASTTKSDDAPSGEMEPGICWFDCDVCKCNCQVTFEECKCQTIANGAARNAANKSKNKPIETRESQQEGGRSLFVNYIWLSVDNYSVQEFQDVDHRMEGEVVSDIATKTAIDVASNTALQCNPHVLHGLQEIIPCRTNVEVTPAMGGKNVSMSYQQARKELKGQGQ